MSMYKNIFVNEDWDASSDQIMGINGEILAFGESAFSSVADAVAAVGEGSAIVIKVASGKYDSFTVVTEGIQTTPNKVVAIDFNGGSIATADGNLTVADSGFSAEAQLSIIDDLNAANAANGTIYVANAEGADTTLYVGMGEASYVVGQSADAAVFAENAEDVVTIVNNANNAVVMESTTAYDENLVISVDTAFDGSVSNSKVTKVVNGATLTIGADAEFTGANMAAGNDNYFGFGEEFDTKGGTIDIYGDVKINQLNADGAGVVNVKENGLLNAAEICIENGSIADAASGVLNVDGTVKTASMRVFNGGVVNVNGTVIGDHLDNVAVQKDISIWGGGAMNINAGGVVTADESMEVGKDGKLLLNGGELSVDETLVNSGLIQIVDGTLDAVVSGSGTVNVLNGADFTNSKDINAGLLYVGYDSTTKSDTAASRLTVAAGTTVKGGNGLYVREESSMAVDGKVIAGQYYLKGDTTVNAGGEMVFGGVQGVTVKDGAVLTIKGSAYADVNDSEPNKINIDVQSNSALVVDGGKLDTTAAGPYGSNSISVANDAKFVITGDSEVRTDAFAGTAQIAGTASLTDSALANGNVYIGYTGYSDTQVDLTVKGDTFKHNGSMYIGTDDAKHTLTIEAADADMNSLYIRAKGEVNITSKDLELSYINQKGAVNINGADVTFREWLIGNTKSADVASVTVTDSVLTQINNGGLTVGYEAAADFTMTNSELNMTYSGLTITAGSTFTMVDSALSTVSISNAGALNISVTADFLNGFAGEYTLVNQSNADAATLDSLEINVAGNKYSVGDSWTVNGIAYSLTNGDGNDIVLSAAHETIFVDSSYTADTEGYGVYKFSSFTSALQAAASSNAINEIKIVSSIDEEIMPTDVEFLVNTDTVITADEAVTINLKNSGTYYDLILGSNNNNTITFDKNITLKLDDRIIWAGYYGNNTDVVIKGTVSAYQWWNGTDTTVEVDGKLVASGEALVLRRGATLTINGDAAQGAAAADRTLQLDANYFNFLSGNLEANNTLIDSGAIWVNNTGNYVYEGSVSIELDNTIWNSSGNLKLNSTSVALMKVENGSILNVNNFDGYGASEISQNGSLWVYDSQATLKDLNNAGDIDIADSSFTVTGTLNNSGTLNIAGTSFTASEVSGEGTFTIGAGATELQIGSLKQDVRANENTGEEITLSGSVGTTSKIRVYGDATLDGFNVNAGFTGNTVSGQGQVLVYGDTVISNSTMSLNYFQATDSVLLKSDSSIKTANINIYDMAADSDFIVQGTIEANTFIVVNDYYNPGSGSEVIIDKGGVLNGLTQNGNGRFDIQSGNMTVYGSVNGAWSAGGGSAYIGNSGYSASLTVDGSYAASDNSNGTFANNDTQTLTVGADGALNVINGAAFDWAAAVTNKGAVSTDADSKFNAGSVVNTGTFNSSNAGEMIVLGDMTVSGNIKTADLIINASASLSAGSITVENLTLAIGSELSLTGTGSSIAADFITVTGSIATAEYQLVLTGWSGDLLGKTVKFDANGNGTIDTDEVFTVNPDDANLFGVNFVSKDGNLYVKDFGSKPSTVFIGDLSGVDGDKVTIDGVTYTVGVDAFNSAAEAAAVIDADLITEVMVGNGDHIDEIATSFANVSKIIIPAGVTVQDEALAKFTGDVVINNDGHLDAQIKVAGDVTMTNTSGNTFIGTLSGDNVNYLNTATGRVENATLEATQVGGGTVSVENLGVIENSTLAAVDGIVDVKGDGTYTNVDVTADALYLNGIDFTLDADSSVKSVYMGMENAGSLTIDGAVIDQVLGGALDASGEVKFTANSNLADTTIEDVSKVILSAGSHEFGAADENREYYMNALELANANLTWSWADADINEYNVGTPVNQDEKLVKVTNTELDAALNFKQTGEYSLTDFDVSAFNGDVNVDAAATLTMKEDSDYFASGADMTVNGTVNLDSAATGGKSTGIDFYGAGQINVNTDHTFAAGSDSDAALDGFTGTLNIGKADTTLTLDGANNTAAALKGAGDVVANADLTLSKTGALTEFTGDIAANSSTVTVKVSGENTTAATFSGTGKVDIQANQTLTAAGALNNLAGTLNNGGKDITLNAVNTVKATVTGSGNIIANADQSFTGNVSAYTGSYTANSDAVNGDYTVTFTKDSTLADNMTLNGDGKFVLESQNASVTVNSDAKATDLSINNNCITINSGIYGAIDGTDSSKVIINAVISADTVVTDSLVINAGKSLDADKVTAESTYVYILNPGEQGPAITVTDTSSEFGEISVNSWSSAFTTPFTIVDSKAGQSYDNTVVFILGIGAGTDLTVDGIAKEIDGKYVRVYVDNGDLLIGNYKGESNVVYVNSDWNTVAGTVYKWTGVDGTPDRIIDLDASKTLENAVAIIRGDENGKGEIYLVKGNTYTTPAAFMTADNQVTELVVTADEVDSTKTAVNVGDVTLRGGVVAMESAGSGKLTLNYLNVAGNVYGGAVVSADAGSAADSTTLTLNGGAYQTSVIAGGSYVTAGTYTVGSSELVIKNTTDKAMVILGRVLGGSATAGQGAVIQDSASVVVDSTNALTIRGDIYAAGSGNVTVDSTSVTFTGDAANLTFTGRVSGGAYGITVGDYAGDSELVFSDFDGVFKGLIQDFDVITVSGDTSLEFSRKQTLTSETGFVFDLNGRTSAEAMFTVNSFGWTYDDVITINAFDGISGDFILIDNYTGDYAADFTYQIGGVAATVGTLVNVGGNDYTLSVVDDSLVLNYVGNNGVGLVDGAELSFADQTIAAGSNGNALSFDGSGDYTDATVSLTDSTVEGNVYTGRYGDVTLSTQGDTTIKGNIDGYAALVEFTVESGKTTVDGKVSSGNGKDQIVVADGAELAAQTISTGNSADLIEIGANSTLNVTGTDINTGNDNDIVSIKDGSVVNIAEDIQLGNQNDALMIGENVTVTAQEINGGIDSDLLVIGKGSSVTGHSLTGFENVTVDVDSILNTSSYSSISNIAINGISDLSVDVAGAKTVVGNVLGGNNVKLDGVDAILGSAVQIAGSDSTAATDDVWASLSKVDGNLVVAWGRTEVEASAALDAFKADNTLALGEALVAADDSLLDGYDSTDTLNKKNNGTLA